MVALVQLEHKYACAGETSILRSVRNSECARARACIPLSLPSSFITLRVYFCIVDKVQKANQPLSLMGKRVNSAGTNYSSRVFLSVRALLKASYPLTLFALTMQMKMGHWETTPFNPDRMERHSLETAEHHPTVVMTRLCSQNFTHNIPKYESELQMAMYYQYMRLVTLPYGCAIRLVLCDPLSYTMCCMCQSCLSTLFP